MNIEIEEEKSLGLTEGEIICPVCKGAGHTKKSIYVCEKCDGSGKVDWVANAMVRKKKERSVLDEINIRRLSIHLRSIFDELQFEPLDNHTIDNLKGKVGYYLSSLKSRKAIDDFQVSEAPSSQGGKCFDINIKPNRTTEIVTMNIIIK